MTECAWIAGATGLVGSHLLPMLLDDPRIGTVISLGRRELPNAHPKLAQRVVDLANIPDDLPAPAFAFCCLGTTMKAAGSKEAFRRVDHDYVVAFAKAARRAGARKLMLVSAVGANADSGVFYVKVKGEAEQAVAAIGFEAVHLARPSLIRGNRKEARFVERIYSVLSHALLPVLIGPFEKYRAIHARRIAGALHVAAFSDAEGVHMHEYDALIRLSS
jgi:uncharacterized protein YbjT (DUF2867 family)